MCMLGKNFGVVTTYVHGTRGKTSTHVDFEFFQLTEWVPVGPLFTFSVISSGPNRVTS